jgi:ABC-type multidrug transport system permease subunit
MRPEIIIALAIPLFVAVFIGFWSLVVRLIAYMSGWTHLAKSFRAAHKPDGRFFSLESAFMSGARYKGTLTVRVTGSGL